MALYPANGRVYQPLPPQSPKEPDRLTDQQIDALSLLDSDALFRTVAEFAIAGIGIHIADWRRIREKQKVRAAESGYPTPNKGYQQ